jgi:hypothetical protein
VIGAETGVECDAEALCAPRDHVALLPHSPEMRAQAAERMPHARRLTRGEIAKIGLGEACAPARCGESREEVVRRALELVHEAGRCPRVVEAARALAIAPQRRHVTQREPGSEPLGCGILELVRLVENDRVVLRQHADRPVGGDAQPEIGEIERVIDDDHIRVGSPLARLLGKAGSRERAARSETALRAHGDLRPSARGRLVIELRSVSAGGRVEPRPQTLERIAVHRVEEPHAELHDHPPAGVVRAALEQLRTDRPAARGSRQRQVVAQQLRLQRERGSGDDDAAPRERRRNEIGETLAGACPGLADERPAARQDLLDAQRHDELRLPLAVGGVRPGERPVRRKQPLEHPISVRGGSRASRD